MFKLPSLQWEEDVSHCLETLWFASFVLGSAQVLGTDTLGVVQTLWVPSARGALCAGSAKP